MHWAAIFKVLGYLLMCLSLSHLPPMAIGWWYDETAYHPFVISGLATLLSGALLWWFTRNTRDEPRTRDGFLIVVLFWTVISLFGALPFIVAETPHLSFADAVFETISGLTTTGATVIRGLDALPKSILYYRQQLHLLGGMGIIVLAVAVLPMLGVGGLQLFRAETSGMNKEGKLTPRVAETAKTLWFIYIALTAACALSYRLNGMSNFDSICYAFATLSTGGFAPHDSNFAFYPQTSLKLWASLFMFLGGLNFSLHYLALHNTSILTYWRNAEFRFFLKLQVAIVAAVVAVLMWKNVYPDAYTAFVETLFHVISISTTTGFVATDFGAWPIFVPILIMIGGLIGGCAGSTTGGLKAIRILVVMKQASRELHRLIHPNGEYILKIDQKMLPDKVIDAVWGFIGVFAVLFCLFLFILMTCGLDFLSAFGAVVASVANVGPGLGSVFWDYADLNDLAKWTLSFSMLVGRLEIFAVMVILTPAFWRQ
ncbi:MAG: TrkH family potassium uptake protein [Gammaproteobacteria bacterium]